MQEPRQTTDQQRDLLIAGWKKKARAAARSGRKRNLYIITLDPKVLDFSAFRKANPNYRDGMPCVYVGLTIHTPGDRFEQHKTGYRSCKYTRRYGVELALDLLEGFDGSGLTDAEQEFALADWLRDQGFGVWQN